MHNRLVVITLYGRRLIVLFHFGFLGRYFEFRGEIDGLVDVVKGDRLIERVLEILQLPLERNDR